MIAANTSFHILFYTKISDLTEIFYIDTDWKIDYSDKNEAIPNNLQTDF